jgi:RES domain-containing protein
VTGGAVPPEVPATRHARSVWFNLRAVPDYSPTAMLLGPETGKEALRDFLRGYGVDQGLDLPDPLAQLRSHLARPAGHGPSRFSDGSFPVVYLADAEATTLAEVAFHLGRRMGDTDADKTRIHYFLLARFHLTGETLDVRKGFARLHLPEDWAPAQAFGGEAWAANAQGITYRSVRRRKASNTVVFRDDLVRSGVRVKIVGLRWEGTGLAQL